MITAIETQGRYGNGTGREFVAEYMIDYLRPGSKWIRYTNRTGHTIMTGNSDTTTSVMRELNPPLFASKLRIVPHSKQTRTICLRTELHGCAHRDGLLYYSTIPGGSRVGEVDFRDTTFENTDLYTDTGIKKVFEALYYSEGMVTLLFEFDQLRNFSEIVLVAYGRLSNIDVIFSADGTNFSLSSQISSLSRSSANSTSKRNDYRIPLHKRMAKKIRVTIWFANDWIFLTEIHFSSVYFNESITTVTLQEETMFTRKSVYSAIGLLALLTLLTVTSCIALMRRRKAEDKFNGFEEDIRKSLIITQVRGKTATEVLSSRHPPPHIMSNLYSTTKTTSTRLHINAYFVKDSCKRIVYNVDIYSLSSKSASPKFGAATWNDFHFPPPPSAPSSFSLLSNKHRCIEAFLVDSYVKLVGKQREDRLAEKIIKIPSSTLQLGADLGQGKHTIVRECYVPTLGNVAYKTAKDRDSFYARNALFDELKTLTFTKNPHIVRLLATDDSGGLLLELAVEGNVRQYLQSQTVVLPTTQLLGICADVCEGMRYLESLGLVHGHLSPTNILIDENSRAKVASPRGPSHHAQLRYSAPESILKVKLPQFTVQQPPFDSKNLRMPFRRAPMFGRLLLAVGKSLKLPAQEHPSTSLSNTDVVENAQRMLAGYDDVAALTFTECVPRGVRNVFVRCFDVDPQARPSFAHISYFMSKYYVAPA
ncbi:hypothetical protein OSTOST_00341 [Ostertagia ostertagi]